MLDPDAVASKTFGSSFRGYDHDEVRRFLLEVAAELRSLAAGVLDGLDDERASRLLGEEAGRLLAAARASAAAAEAKGEERAASLVREAQEEALRLRSGVEAERERAYAEGAARAEEVLADAERSREELLEAARAEAAQLVREAEDARELVLKDLARRRKALRVQVEQLHAAREELLKAIADVHRIGEDARNRLVVAVPEAKLAADAAARRAEAEDEVPVEQLEAELEAFRLAGLQLPPAEPEGDAADAEAPATDAPVEPDAAAEAPATDDERVSSSVRVFRANRGVVEAELHEVDPAASFETVRVITDDAVEEAAPEPEPEPEAAAAAAPETAAGPEPGPEPEAVTAAEPPPEPEPEREPPAAGPEPAAAAQPEAEPELAVGAEGAPGAVAERPASETVDALFARLRAGRQERTAAAEATLASEAEAETEAETAPVPLPEPEPEHQLVHAGGPDRDALLARRDELLAGPTAALGKRLKRLLADEQNTVLDALRREGAQPEVVVAPEDLAARWATAAADDLGAAAAAGSAFVDLAGAVPPELHDVAAALADATAAPLAERLAAAVRRADGDVDLAADGVRSVCREWRARRLADAIDHAVHAAFGRGALTAVGADDDAPPLCWIVDDGGSPCPDAEDNALAGPVPAGEPFPTGHLHPPAHPGCRCVLAVAAVAVAR